MCGEMIVANAGEVPLLRRGLRLDPQESQGRRRKRSTVRRRRPVGGDIAVGLLCSGIGCIAGIVWMIQGKPKGWKMVALSIVADVVKSVVLGYLKSQERRRHGPLSPGVVGGPHANVGRGGRDEDHIPVPRMRPVAQGAARIPWAGRGNARSAQPRDVPEPVVGAQGVTRRPATPRSSRPRWCRPRRSPGSARSPRPAPLAHPCRPGRRRLRPRIRSTTTIPINSPARIPPRNRCPRPGSPARCAARRSSPRRSSAASAARSSTPNSRRARRRNVANRRAAAARARPGPVTSGSASCAWPRGSASRPPRSPPPRVTATEGADSSSSTGWSSAVSSRCAAGSTAWSGSDSRAADRIACQG